MPLRGDRRRLDPPAAAGAGIQPAFTSEGARHSRGCRALLISAPGEQNLLGVFPVSEFCRSVASEFFHRSGWNVWHRPPTSRGQLLELVHKQWFDVIDVSVSSEGRLPELGADISEMRRVSRNTSVSVTVGGPVFFDHPEFTSSIGADACSADARDTVTKAEMQLSLRQREKSATTYY